MGYIDINDGVPYSLHSRYIINARDLIIHLDR